MKQPILLLFISLLLFSCHSNKLKTDEKQLEKQILTEEEQLAREAALRAEREKQLADSIAKLPKGFRFKEERKTDPKNPPIIIDVIGSRAQNTPEIRLSKLFKQVEYVLLEPDPDSLLATYGFNNIVVGEKHIYGFSLRAGIAQYSLDGRFIGFICKNNIPGSQIPGGGTMLGTSDPIAKMAWSVFYANSHLCYKYLDRETQTTSYYQFDDKMDCSSILTLPSHEGEAPENQPKGEKYAAFSDEFISKATTLFPLPGGMKAQVQNRKPVAKALPFISVISTSGDTVCTFQDNDPIVNFSKTVYRGVDDGNNYYFNQTLHLRPSYNDTIYCLIPPNRLIPKYIFEFGAIGIPSSNPGIDPGFDLEEKLILHSFLETDRYLFITYSKNYDCPATAKDGTLKFSRIIYDKKKEELIPVYTDQAPFMPDGKMTWPSPPQKNILNDLDGVPFQWPSTTTPDDKPYSILPGKDLLDTKDLKLPIEEIKENSQIIAIYR